MLIQYEYITKAIDIFYFLPIFYKESTLIDYDNNLKNIKTTIKDFYYFNMFLVENKINREFILEDFWELK